MRITLSPYRHLYCHCEERSDVAFQSIFAARWIASRSLSSGARSRDPLARNDVNCDSRVISDSIDKRRLNAMAPVVHPGRLLKRELVARKLSANRLALDIGVPSGRITDILNGRRAITADTAVRLGRDFGTSRQVLSGRDR